MSPEIFLEQDDSNLKVKIMTHRLEMKSIKKADFTDYQQLLGSEINMKKFAQGTPWAEEKVMHLCNMWMQRWSKNDPFSSLTVFERSTKKFIGYVVLGHAGLPGVASLAYIFKSEFWRQGYGKEVVMAVVQHYALELAQRSYQVDGAEFTTIEASVRPDNIASIKILQAVGLCFLSEKIRYGENRLIYSTDLATLFEKRKEI